MAFFKRTKTETTTTTPSGYPTFSGSAARGRAARRNASRTIPTDSDGRRTLRSLLRRDDGPTLI